MIDHVLACLTGHADNLIEPARALPALELTLDVHQRLARLTSSPRVHPAGLCSLLAILLIGAIMCRTKITVQSGAERHLKDAEAAGRALLTVILVGSRLECREDGHSRASVLGGRNGGRPGTGSARGSARAAARRAPQGAKAELPVRSR
jgi:hypothetical protein